MSKNWKILTTGQSCRLLKGCLTGLILVSCLAMTPAALAQTGGGGQFAPLPENGAVSPQDWPPLPTADSSSQPPRKLVAPPPAATDFQPLTPLGSLPPETPLRVDPQVQQADLTLPAPQPLVDFDATEPAATPTGVESDSAPSPWLATATQFVSDVDVPRMLGSLALVLGGYFGLIWVVGLWQSAQRRVPTEVLEVLGCVPFGARKNLQLVRIGSKLLLLINSPEGTQSIGEITDPAEVEHLASLCPGRKRVPPDVAQRIRAAANTMRSDAAPGVSNPPLSTAGSDNHLAAILQSLEGSRRGGTAIFEA